MTDIIPLVVDMDGTLVINDVTCGAVISYVGFSPVRAIKIYKLWKHHGGGAAKAFLATQMHISPEKLYYNQAVVKLCQRAKENGRMVVLATASSAVFANAVAGNIGIFDEVLGSDANIDLKSHNKAEVLTQKYGDKGFDYAGNSMQDLAVWRYCKTAYLVHPDLFVHEKLLDITTDIIPLPLDNRLMTIVKGRTFAGVLFALMGSVASFIGDGSMLMIMPVAFFIMFFGIMLLGDIISQRAMMNQKKPSLLIYSPISQSKVAILLIMLSLLLPLLETILGRT